MLYRVAPNTSYRVTELASLTPDSFDLDAKTPAIVLAGVFTRNRCAAVQPIAKGSRRFGKGEARRGCKAKIAPARI
jgi:hypothetical protein